MFLRNLLISFIAASLLAVAGCGGGGIDADADNPDGSFSMSMDPSTDGSTGRHFALELEVVEGEIDSGFARYVTDEFLSDESSNIDGEVSDGNIDVVATFKGYTIEIQAEYGGLGWHGSYVRRVDKLIVEEGELAITRSDSTPEVVGTWEGDIDVDGVLFPAFLTFIQKGNLVACEGTIDGDPVEGFGSVIGRSIYFEIIFGVDSTGWLFLGNVNGGTTRMTGSGRQPLNFTFDFEKVPPKP